MGNQVSLDESCEEEASHSTLGPLPNSRIMRIYIDQGGPLQSSIMTAGPTLQSMMTTLQDGHAIQVGWRSLGEGISVRLQQLCRKISANGDSLGTPQEDRSLNLAEVMDSKPYKAFIPLLISDGTISPEDCNPLVKDRPRNCLVGSPHADFTRQ